jgi:CBS domain containing-hemolysin-like protein
MDPDSSSLILLIALIILSGLFSSSETALFSLSRAKIQALVAANVRGAKLIEALKNRPQKMLVIILLGNNIANVGATAVATVYFTRAFEHAGLGVATGIMTLLILVFGEVIPKSVATKFSVKVAQFVIYPLTFLEYVLFPIIWIFEKALTTLVGEHIHHVSEEEVKAIVSMGAEEGSIEKHEQEFIENVLKFDDTSVESIMTPRTELDALEAKTTVADAIKYANECEHSRLPVYEESIDNIIGFVTVKMLLSLSTDEDTLAKSLKEIELYEFIESPTTQLVNSLFLEFKKKRTHIALVYDEHGGVEGIVTMEDVLEEIVGDMSDEADTEEEPILVLAHNSIVVDGDIPVEDVQAALDIEIPSYDDKDLLSWMILDFLKRFPEKGESVVIDHTKFTVEEMEGNKIEKVRVVKL